MAFDHRGRGSGRVENRLAPALPHQTVRAVFRHTAFRFSSYRGMRRVAWTAQSCSFNCSVQNCTLLILLCCHASTLSAPSQCLPGMPLGLRPTPGCLLLALRVLSAHQHSDYAASRCKRLNVSGKLRTRSISVAACSLGLLRPCSQFSRVRMETL